MTSRNYLKQQNGAATCLSSSIAPKAGFRQGLTTFVMIPGYSLNGLPTGIFGTGFNRTIQGNEAARNGGSCAKNGHERFAGFLQCMRRQALGERDSLQWRGQPSSRRDCLNKLRGDIPDNSLYSVC